jgi:hypothetical protein
MERIELTARDGRIDATLAARQVGDDWLVEITGGDAHIGAAALATFDPIHARASASVLSVPGHREEQVALDAARTISRATRGTALLVAGLHYPHITVEEIDTARRLCRELVERFLARLGD